jgi:peptidoglycan/xylan/chitin deacetylase (PgdA/CDA1 family)
VIYYHRVGRLIEGGPLGAPSDGGAMITPPAHLEAHIALLRGLGYSFATAGELARHWRGRSPPRGIAVLTFDDGWRDDLTTVAPMLTRLGVRATFFICPAGFGKRFPRFGDAVVMSEDEARALHEVGMELASHSLSHPDLRALSDSELRLELVSSREAVEALTAESCLTLAYPSGWHDRRVERATADAGYQLAFTDRHGPWRKFAVPRVHAPTIAAPETLIDRLRLPSLGPEPLSSWARRIVGADRAKAADG